MESIIPELSSLVCGVNILPKSLRIPASGRLLLAKLARILLA